MSTLVVMASVFALAGGGALLLREVYKRQQWDSVGHMTLIAALEDAFDIMVDMDDIIDRSSFEKGKEILRKYDVEI